MGNAMAPRRLKTIAVVGTGKDALIPPRKPRHKRATEAGAAIARLGFNLITGGGQGAMKVAAKAFCSVEPRKGVSIGIIPGTVQGLGHSPLGKIRALKVMAKEGHPNEWIEVVIQTHLSGKDRRGKDKPKSAHSRNLLNARSADVVVALAGDDGTQAEFELALGLGKCVIAFVSDSESVGRYSLEELTSSAFLQQHSKFACVQDEKDLEAELKMMVSQNRRR